MRYGYTSKTKVDRFYESLKIFIQCDHNPKKAEQVTEKFIEIQTQAQAKGKRYTCEEKNSMGRVTILEECLSFTQSIMQFMFFSKSAF